MPRDDSPTGRPTTANELTPVHQRSSRRLQGATPEFGLLPAATRGAKAHTLSSATMTTGSSAQGQFVLHQPRTPQAFHGDLFEDAEDWLSHFERVARFNQWDDAAKLRNVYFSLENGARTWIDNRDGKLGTWQEFCHEFLRAYASMDRREKAEHALRTRVQLPNESVSMYVEEMTRLFRRADPNMAEETKLRHLMRGVKEQLFGCLVRNPPKTVAEFISEASVMENTLRQRSNVFESQVLTAAPVNGPNAAFGDSMGGLRDLIRSVVREELHKILGTAPQPTAGTIASIVREEVQQAFRASPAYDDAAFRASPSYDDAAPALPEPVQLTYAQAMRRPLPAAVLPPHPAPRATEPLRGSPYFPERRRKTELWRTPDLRPLCYHCGEAGHVYRQCPYRELGLRGFAIDAPRPRPGQRPRDIEDYLTNQRGQLQMSRRPSRSPSPRRNATNHAGTNSARSPSPRREN